ncbi:MAG: CHRD domain protein [Gemmatimonadetes bacterium]|nr:MAG: CHRD domain protein [Gemmatimonadota bacterium]
MEVSAMLRFPWSRALAPALALVGLACDNDNTAPAAATRFSATLTGANERPTPNASTATGTATFTIDETAGTITYTVNVTNITNVTASHIHVGRADAAGPVVVNLLAATPPAGTINGQLATGTITAASIGTGVPITFASLTALMRSGDIYANVHTQANPGGEIRGQLVAAP